MSKSKMRRHAIMGKPREWEVIGGIGGYWNEKEVVYAVGPDPGSSTRVRVIEYEAYDQLQRDKDFVFEEMRAANLKLEKERDEVRAQAEIWEARNKDLQEWPVRCARLVEALGLASGALQTIDMCPDNFNRDGLSKLISKLHLALAEHEKGSPMRVAVQLTCEHRFKCIACGKVYSEKGESK